MLRTVLHLAARSSTLRRAVTEGRLPRRVALRYVAGETLEEGLAAVRRQVALGRSATLDYVGEHVAAAGGASAAAEVYHAALRRIRDERLPCGVSLKPSQLGAEIDQDLALELIDGIARAAEDVGVHVTLDMESSDTTELTVRLVERLHAMGRRNVGCALQAALRRTGDDTRRLSPPVLRPGASIRLCKGAYAEPPAVAHQRRAAVAQSYAALADWLLEHGEHPRFATHDHRLIDHIKSSAARLRVPATRFEFQMLYGVRTALQDRLLRDGWGVCVYVPFGSDWYAYFARRLAERPANLLLFLRALRGS